MTVRDFDEKEKETVKLLLGAVSRIGGGSVLKVVAEEVVSACEVSVGSVSADLATTVDDLVGDGCSPAAKWMLSLMLGSANGSRELVRILADRVSEREAGGPPGEGKRRKSEQDGRRDDAGERERERDDTWFVMGMWRDCVVVMFWACPCV